MKSITSYIKRVALRLVPAVALLPALAACDSFVYDGEGDCSVTYRVAFRYDRNMKWADAFAGEVKSVRLYAFGEDGVLAWQGSEQGDALAADGYTMTLDVPAGDYTLLAWCGLDNDAAADEEGGESFKVGEAVVGRTTLEEMQCRMEREYEGESALSRKKLHPLFHSLKEVHLPEEYVSGGVYTYTMPLTKDTNHVRIILQHMSGEPVDPADFTFTIEEENGLMAHDNELLDDEMITYVAHNTSSGIAGMGLEDYPEYEKGVSIAATTEAAPPARAITSVSVAIADLTIPRLTEGRKTYLTVRKNGSEEDAARIPLTDYALMLKDGYDRPMTDQDYLDRQDEWALTFFLDESHKWIATSIVINAWRVVPNKVNFGEQQ